ncbi:hypothetical protein HPB52_009048 [Rhipicephalus sanguineus]|uniref:DUF4806 domain-containing protein n=1 Tax=Rhipicephalus sanguineus TaxID=34632 RepID=A0A9D4PYZ5_RHISA|nr:hypothetical protein HPB52_009048 [Rhipicephalus sanguineus]
MMQQQGEVLNMIVKTLSSPSVAPCAAPVIEQPFSRLEEFLAFDEKLDKEAPNTLVNEFVQLGGTDGNWATKRILAYCMTDEMATKFSWMGRKRIQSFSALKIAKVVKGLGEVVRHLKTVRSSPRITQEEKRRTRQASKKAIQQDSGATSEEEEHHGSEESEASVDAGAEQLTANQNEEEFPAIPQSQGGTSVEERGCKSTPLQRLLKADKKLFKALSIIAAEAAENESVATQIDLIINEVAKMKALILEATHEVASLQGELRATHGTRSTGPMLSMADVVRAASPGDQGRPPRPIKPTEAIGVRSANHDPENLAKLISKSIDPCTLGL